MTLVEIDWSLILWSLICLLLIAAFIRAAYSLWGRNDIHQSTKLLWTIFMLLAPFLGFLFYMIFGGRSDFEIEEDETT